MIELCIWSRRQFGWLVAACVLLSVNGLQAEPPQLAVSSFALDAISLTPPTAQQVVTQLAGESWCQATATETKGAWNQVPSGVDRQQWISLVTVGFNGQADTYAFMFDGPEGAMSMAMHVPFREVWLPGGVAAWIFPTDSVLGALRVSYQDRSSQPTRRLLKLSVVPWEDAPDAPAVTKSANLDDAQTLAPELVFPPVAVMAHAAAFAAGWQPTSAEAPVSATCQVKVEDQACSFRITLRTGTAEQTLTKLHVPWETYHEHLVRLFRFIESSHGVSDFVQVTRQPTELLSLHDGRLACLMNHELAVFDLKSGKKAWTTEPPVKPANYLPVPQYGWLKKESGEARLIRYRPTLAEFNWETGKPTPLAPTAADLRHRFSSGASGELAAANGGVVALHRQGKSVWSEKEADGVSAGPSLAGTDLIFGQATGRLVARSSKDGKIRWQSRLPGSLYGQIVPAGDSLLIFSNAAEALIAVDIAKGTTRWQCDVADVLLEAPVVVGNQVLLVTKGNRLLLVELASGKIHKAVTWPTWLVSASVINTRPKPLLACADLNGAVTLLSLSDLETTRTFAVGAQLNGPVLLADQLSNAWPLPQAAESEENLLAEIKSGPGKSGPALMAADVQGFIYILPLSNSE